MFTLPITNDHKYPRIFYHSIRGVYLYPTRNKRRMVYEKRKNFVMVVNSCWRCPVLAVVVFDCVVCL